MLCTYGQAFEIHSTICAVAIRRIDICLSRHTVLSSALQHFAPQQFDAETIQDSGMQVNGNESGGTQQLSWNRGSAEDALTLDT